MKIKVQFNGPVRQLNNWKNVANIELPDGATGQDLLDYFKIVPKQNRLYGFLIRDGKKMKEEEVLNDGDVIKVNGKSAGG
ncbi:MAG: MoaD/ThiS family protein [Firmicutes bacterium]|nr:MoaD/ThiS family protein [Bacillota bacterium]